MKEFFKDKKFIGMYVRDYLEQKGGQIVRTTKEAYLVSLDDGKMEGGCICAKDAINLSLMQFVDKLGVKPEYIVAIEEYEPKS